MLLVLFTSSEEITKKACILAVSQDEGNKAGLSFPARPFTHRVVSEAYIEGTHFLRGFQPNFLSPCLEL